MAAGIPVVTNKRNGAGEIIQEGENGTVIDSPLEASHAVTMIHYWKKKAGISVKPDLRFLSIDRNVEETMQVLELAAEERRRLRAA